LLETIIEKLSVIPSGAWIGLAGVVIGAIISIFCVCLTNRSNTNQLRMQLEHERQSRTEDLKRERLEELYILVGHWLNMFAGHYISLSMVMQGKLDYNQHLDQVIEGSKKQSHDFNRLRMLLDIYARELKPAYEKVLEARDELNEIATKHRHAYERGDLDGKRFLKPYTTTQLKIERLGEALKK
jgi:hypothetical protein